MLIDISRLCLRLQRGQRPTGVDRLCLAYVQQHGKHARAIFMHKEFRRIVGYEKSQELFGLLLAQPADLKTQLIRFAARFAVPPWPAQDARNELCLYLGHEDVNAPGFSDWVAKTRQRPVFFLHDLIPIEFPEFARSEQARAHGERVCAMLRLGAGVVVNSNATAAALHQFAYKHKIDVPPISVTPLATTFAPSGAPPPGPVAPGSNGRITPYFVTLGTIEPRKNHMLLLHVWRQLLVKHGVNTPKLLILGQRGWDYESVARVLSRCTDLREYVREVTAPKDEQVAAFLQNARALLFPSFAEGYGLPLLEALSLGTPVIASDLPVFKEVAGDIPEYLSPIDGLGWLNTIDQFAFSDTARNQQLTRMKNWRTPLWQDHFQIFDDLVRQISARTA
jgi:glycosyltransferase involved in cell wall biosynthesis